MTTTVQQIPLVRFITAETASLVAQADVGRGMGYGKVDALRGVSAARRKAVLWAVAWVEGQTITARELAALAGMDHENSANRVLHSLERDGLVVVDGPGPPKAGSYRLNREGLAQIVRAVRLGGRRNKCDGEGGEGGVGRVGCVGRVRDGCPIPGIPPTPASPEAATC